MKLHAGDWLWNASLVGYLRIQKARFEKGAEGPWKRYEAELQNSDYIDVQPADLNGFADAYFTHILCLTHSSMFRKFSLSETTKKKIGRKVNDLISDEVEKLKNSKIDGIRHNLNYSSYSDSSNNLDNLVKDYQNKISSIVETMLIKYDIDKKTAEKEAQRAERESKKTKKIESLILGITSNFYHNERVLTQPNISKHGRTRKDAFDNVYDSSAKNVIMQAILQDSNKPKCRFCKEIPISDLDNYSFFSERNFKLSGTSLEKFANHFYFLQSDLLMCNLCQLILFCSWAGFNSIPFNMRNNDTDAAYAFVSIPSLLVTWEENEKIANEFSKSQINTKNMIYEIVMEDLFLRRQRMKSVWVLQNTLFVEIKPESQKNKAIQKVTTFNIGKDIANMFARDEISIRTLTNLRGKLKFKGNPTIKRNDDIWINVKRDVVRRLLSNETLYPISDALLRNIIEAPHSSSMETLRKICLISSIRAVNNSEKLNAGGHIMESRTVHGIINGYARIGKQLAEGIDFERRRRLSYRLLSNIRSGCVEDFYDGIMKLYVDKGISIPDNMIGLLNREDEIQFEDKAYAFMSGFLRDQNEPKVEQNKIGDDE